MKALTSGRLDPPHPGHIVNIRRMAKKYGKVKMVLLDYPERRFPIDYCYQVMVAAFEDDDRIEIVINSTHFGEITLEEIKGYDCDIYCGGNFDVLNHIHRLGFPIRYTERCFEYSARDIQRPE